MPPKTAPSGRTYASHYADVHVLVRRGDHLLVGRRSDQQRVFPGCYQVPAGLMEEGEAASSAAARELREETGLDIPAEKLRFVHLMHHVSTHTTRTERLAFFFEADDPGSDVVNTEPEKCDGWDWHQADGIPQPTAPYLALALRHIADGTSYSEFAWTVSDTER
ncbi:NUDIX domain-containing protein [Streptomyces sp. NPDC001502]|uniref:NUDIX domain-containing protein n=1 Tax=Streptomyces sp. NPDC001502 TaxID=3364578 RepID=UPI0036A85E9F